MSGLLDEEAHTTHHSSKKINAIKETDEDEPKKPCCPSFTPFVLMIALSIHAIFEGLALGLSPNYSGTLNLVIAILIHKGAAASALGISLVKTFPEDFTLVRWLIFSFACASPIGVGIGMALDNSGALVQIIFTSFAAGSFVYIACSEVIISEFSIPGNRGWKLLAFIFGATTITMLFFLEKNGEEDDG